MVIDLGPRKREGAFEVFDGMAVEVEVAEFLYALVRLTKPALVIESGTGRGAAAFSLASGLAANGRGLSAVTPAQAGRLVTYEPMEVYRTFARERLSAAGLPAEVRAGSSLDWAGATPDLVFLDSHRDFRAAEIRRWQAEPVLLIVHDAHRDYGLDKGWFFDTPRGLWMRDRR